MYIIDKKEKIKINDVDRFEGFALFGRELDGISKILLLIIAGLIAALIYMYFFQEESPSTEGYTKSPESIRSEPVLPVSLKKSVVPAYRSESRRTSKKKSSR
jgi:hypothetical protein